MGIAFRCRNIGCFATGLSNQIDTATMYCWSLPRQLSFNSDGSLPELCRPGIHWNLTTPEIKRIGFPWSEKMVERSCRSSGATLMASRAALSEFIAVNLAGGTHHAMYDAGEGYCVFNDAAVTIKKS